MTVRTFKQFAQGYGATPTSITVKLDGQEIFSGEIATENAPLPSLPDSSVQILNEIFTWEKDTTFTGTMALEISVQGSPLLLADSLANYHIDLPEYADKYLGYYSEVIDGVTYTDSFTNEQIDGISVSRSENPALSGQWWWTIMPGSTFTATVNILASLPPPTV